MNNGDEQFGDDGSGLKRKNARWGSNEAGSDVDVVFWQRSDLGRDVIR